MKRRILILGMSMAMLSACGGGGGGGGSISVSQQRLFLQPYENEAVDISRPTGVLLGTNFSEAAHNVTISTGDCRIPASNCEAWDNVPLSDALPGSHIVTVGRMNSVDESGRVKVDEEYRVTNLPSSLLDQQGATRLSSSSFANTIYVHQTNAPLRGWGSGVGEAAVLDGRRLADFYASLPRDMNFGSLAFQRVIPGATHALIIGAGNNLLAFGDNDEGQLGDGSQQARRQPVAVTGMDSVTEVDLGVDFSLAVRQGEVWAWGNNAEGQLGDGSKTRRTTAVRVQGLDQVARVAAGNRFSMAMRLSDRSVWAWGTNNYFQLAQSSINDSSVPIRITGVPTAQDIAAGDSHALVLATDGSVWGWGSNGAGQLGLSTSFGRVPTQIPGLSNCSAIAAGTAFSMALCNGQVYTWGANDFGQLGRPANSGNGVQVVAGLSGVTEIAAGSAAAYAIRGDCSNGGSVWSWGRMPALGRGSDDDEAFSARPAPVVGFGDQGSCTSSRVWVYRTGDGNGTLSSDTGNLDCDGFYCWVDILGAPTSIQITATPAADSMLGEWRWDCAAAGSAATATVNMSAGRLCKVRFDRMAEDYRLDISISGAGTVTSTPAGINCGEDCYERYSENTRVTLNAQPAPGYRFAGYSGACIEGVVTMNSDLSCTASFVPGGSEAATLNVRHSGPGAGVVTSLPTLGRPLAIDCGNDCNETLPMGSTVTLVGNASPGSFFSHWIGCDSVEVVDTEIRCLITLNADRLVTADFE